MELLYELLPLPAEIVSHIATVSSVCFCPECNQYKCDGRCRHCQCAICTSCVKRCWQWTCCKYCDECAVLWKCYDIKDWYNCSCCDKSKSPACEGKSVSPCARCHLPLHCSWCEKSSCCKHAAIALPSIPLYICVHCYQRQRSKLDKKLLGELQG